MHPCFELGRPVPAKGVGYGLARTRFSCFRLVVRLLATGYTAAAPLPIFSQNSDLVFEWVIVTKLNEWPKMIDQKCWCHIFDTKRSRFDVTPGFAMVFLALSQMWQFSGNRYKCDDFSILSRHFFGFDQTWVWKHCQVLGSRCRAPRFWLGTNLIFFLYYWS